MTHRPHQLMTESITSTSRAAQEMPGDGVLTQRRSQASYVSRQFLLSFTGQGNSSLTKQVPNSTSVILELLTPGGQDSLGIRGAGSKNCPAQGASTHLGASKRLQPGREGCKSRPRSRSIGDLGYCPTSGLCDLGSLLRASIPTSVRRDSSQATHPSLAFFPALFSQLLIRLTAQLSTGHRHLCLLPS